MSKEFKMVRLGDCATFINGKAFKPSDWVDEGVPIIRIQNLTGSSSEVNYFNGNIEDKYRITDGDILISWSASLGIFIWNSGNAVLNQHIFKVQFDKLNFDKSYFFYMIQDALDTMSAQVHGATMKHITKSNFDNISVLYPSITKQQEIAAVLDKASELVEKRKAQLAELDALAESIFYDMFGDPVTNEKGWNIKKVKDISKEKLSYGAGASAIEFDGNVRYVRITDICDNGELNSNLVSPSDCDDKYILNDGDILFARSGATVGKTYRYKSTAGRCLYAGYLIRLIPNLQIVLPDYVYYFTRSQYYKNFIASNVKVVAQPNINAQQYGDLKICVPSLLMQQQFAERIEKIEEQKQKVKAALKESEDLFQRLMQDMFSVK